MCCAFFMQVHLQRSIVPLPRYLLSLIYWHRFTTRLAATIICSISAPLTSKARVNVLIFDDSIYHRAYSKKVNFSRFFMTMKKRVFLRIPDAYDLLVGR